MKYIPMLYSTPMVQAIKEDRKNQTRRTKGLNIINEYPDDFEFDRFQLYDDGTYRAIFFDGDNFGSVVCPYGQPGDVIWVRESFHKIHGEADDLFLGYGYKADNDYKGALWIPSIHMPKIAARLFLRIKDIRVERLRDISVWSAESEGVEKRMAEGSEEFRDYLAKDQNTEMFGKWGSTYYSNSLLSFFSLWEKINGSASVELNPWVWVIEFERIDKPEDFIS